MKVLLVTGTDTGVGKTVASAALAVRAREHGTVVVVKPVQTGVGPGYDDYGDVDEVHRLTGCATQEFTALDEPLAPDTAARRQGVRIPTVAEYADRIRVLTEFHDTVVVEGAGGLLVRLDEAGGTLLDLAVGAGRAPPGRGRGGLPGRAGHPQPHRADRRRAAGPGARAGRAGDRRLAGDPGTAETCNAEDLPRVTGLPLLAVLPDGAGRLDRDGVHARRTRLVRLTLSLSPG